jgi:hypothetical protein
MGLVVSREHSKIRNLEFIPNRMLPKIVTKPHDYLLPATDDLPTTGPRELGSWEARPQRRS